MSTTSNIGLDLHRWWDWYSQALWLSRSASEWNWIERVATETHSEHPVISVEVASKKQLAAGYCVLAAGGLAIHGGVTQRPPAASQRLSDVHVKANSDDLTALCVERLILESFSKKAELYQALTPAPLDLPESHRRQEDEFSRAGMLYLTRLVRMELAKPDAPNSSGYSAYALQKTAGHAMPEAHRLRIEPYQSVPYHLWVELIERTYQDSRDVPELAAFRTIEKSLEGYRANRTPGVEGWFVILCDSRPAGCLILSRSYHPTGEISYLGLSPEFRGQGFSFEIMRFALNWMSTQKCSKVALAVDCRNEVALNVYQNWGFQATISYHAWIASPKSFQPTFFHSLT